MGQRTLVASQLASSSHLGTFIGEYPNPQKPEVIRMLSGFGMLLLGILLIYFGAFQSTALVAIAGAVFGAFGLVFSLRGILFLVSRRMYAFTDGFIYFKRGKPVVFRWEDVKFILNTQTRQGLIVTYSVDIHHADGHFVTFVSRDIGPLISLLNARVAGARVVRIN